MDAINKLREAIEENNNMQKERNAILQQVKTEIPTYAELVEYAQQKQQIQKHRPNLSNEIVKEDIQETNTNTDTLGLDARTEETNTMYGIVNEEAVDEQNTSSEELIQLLVKEKKEKEMLLKEKNELLQEKQTLLRENEKTTDGIISKDCAPKI
ncbi:hypothetical protein RF55_15434 [Lasius niger]|uniref:Uncharacterized protein n=1 Tax=Lasius niger TaxID=67767 RepID=A0A0J7K5Z8_LASNI|nr:hypothetical protein RF55_15434 [Lasius niger]